MTFSRNWIPIFYLTAIFLIQEQYHLAAFVLAVNQDFAPEVPVTHNVSSRKIGDQWITINDKELYRGQLDDEKCFISMAVYRSQSQAPADDFIYNVDNLQSWRACLEQHRQSQGFETSLRFINCDCLLHIKVRFNFMSYHLIYRNFKNVC